MPRGRGLRGIRQAAADCQTAEGLVRRCLSNPRAPSPCSRTMRGLFCARARYPAKDSNNTQFLRCISSACTGSGTVLTLKRLSAALYHSLICDATASNDSLCAEGYEGPLCGQCKSGLGTRTCLLLAPSWPCWRRAPLLTGVSLLISCSASRLRLLAVPVQRARSALPLRGACVVRPSPLAASVLNNLIRVPVTLSCVFDLGSWASWWLWRSFPRWCGRRCAPGTAPNRCI